MSDCDFQPLLAAYRDGELDGASRRRIEGHLTECPACAAELARLRALSAQIEAAAVTADLDAGPDAMARMHRAVDRAAAADDLDTLPLLRTAGLLAALAASVLIISGVWLLDLRHAAGTAAATGGGGSGEVAAIPPDWERIATTLRAQPRPGVGDDSPFAPRYAAAIDWMLDSLLPPPNPRTEGKPWPEPRSF